MFTKMVSMARTPDEAKEEIAKYSGSTPSPMATVPTYPYGLCLSLDDDTMKKLGMTGDLPSVGDVLQFSAIAKVTSASMNESEKSDGSKEQCTRIELQITDMGVPSPDPADRAAEHSEQRRQRFYGAPKSTEPG